MDLYLLSAVAVVEAVQAVQVSVPEASEFEQVA